MKKLLMTVLFISASQVMGMCQIRNIFNTIKRSPNRCTNSSSKEKIKDQILDLSRSVDHINTLETIVQDPNHELRKPQYTPGLMNHLFWFNQLMRKNLNLKEEKIYYFHGHTSNIDKEHTRSQCLTSFSSLKKIIENRQWALYNTLNYNICSFTEIENDDLKYVHTKFLLNAIDGFGRDVIFPDHDFKTIYEAALYKNAHCKEKVLDGERLSDYQPLLKNWFETTSKEDIETFHRAKRKYRQDEFLKKNNLINRKE